MTLRPIAAAALIILIFAAVHEAGRVLTGYDSYPSDSLFPIGTGKVSAAQAAESYSPLVAPGSAEAPHACYYTVLSPDPQTLVLLYRFAWPDELASGAWWDGAYRGFRRLYYGSTRDLEYVRVWVDLPSGRLKRADFESPLEREGLTEHDPRSLEGPALPSQGTHPLLRVAGWNHLFEPARPDDTAAPTPLEFLDTRLYGFLRIARSSSPPRIP